MNRHLSARQVSEWLAGERSREAEEHVDDCTRCRSHLSQFEEVLGSFRESASHWAGEQAGERPLDRINVETRGQRLFAGKLEWTALAIALIMIVCLSLAWRGHVINGRDRAAADAALLNLVDEHISRTVPGPMEPLTKLLSWDVTSDAPPGRPQRTEKE